MPIEGTVQEEVARARSKTAPPLATLNFPNDNVTVRTSIEQLATILSMSEKLIQKTKPEAIDTTKALHAPKVKEFLGNKRINPKTGLSY